jgi:hypothetical protein
MIAGGLQQVTIVAVPSRKTDESATAEHCGGNQEYLPSTVAALYLQTGLKTLDLHFAIGSALGVEGMQKSGHTFGSGSGKVF